MTPPRDRRTVRRCHSCGSRLPTGEARCAVCGAGVPWYLTPRGVVLESVVAVLAVVLAIGALLWLRGRDVPLAEEVVTNVYQAVTALPTTPATFTPAPSATATLTTTASLAPADQAPADQAPAPAGAAEGPGQVTAAGSISYTVQSGDNLWSISQELDIPLETIRAANPGADQRLDVGQVLTIPATPGPGVLAAAVPAEATPDATPAPTGPPPEPELYAVQPGDSLAAIAAHHGLAVADLQAMNQADLGSWPEEVEPGQLLRVRALAGPKNPAAPTPASPLPFAAPIPLAPADGVTVEEDAPLLRWVSAGLLPDDVYYVVSLRDAAAASEDGEELVWIMGDANTLTLPARFRPALGASRTIAWQVSVRRAGGGAPGDGPGQMLCPAPETRTVVWAP